MSMAARGSDAAYCSDVGGEEGHHMVSHRIPDAEMVRWVERCSFCGWIDGKALDGWAEAAIKENSSKMAQRIAVATETEPFAFVQQRGQVLTLAEILHQALGAASMCWEFPNRAGEFNGERAKAISKALIAEVDNSLAIVQHRVRTPLLNLAYEMYALVCNSQPGPHADPELWNEAFTRLKSMFHELLEGSDDAGDGAEVPQPEMGVQRHHAGGAGQGDGLPGGYADLL